MGKLFLLSLLPQSLIALGSSADDRLIKLSGTAAWLPRKSVQWPKPSEGYIERSTKTRLCLADDIERLPTLTHESAPEDSEDILTIVHRELVEELARASERQADCTKDNKDSVPSPEKLIKTIQVHITGAMGGAADLTKDVDESYKLNVTETSVEITAPSVFGARLAYVTLSNMLEVRNFRRLTDTLYGDRIPQGYEWHYILPYEPFVINDRPRLSHRGLMLDTARHYQEIRDLYKVIDGLSRAKMNVFHWHATDDQSFPLVFDHSKDAIHGAECNRKQPGKHCTGAYTGYATYHQYIVTYLAKYARLRGVRLYLEIDQPAHAQSWANRDPSLTQCDNTDDDAHCFPPVCGPLNLKGKYKEVRDLADMILVDWINVTTPGEIIHLGMDEIGPHCWGQETTDALTARWLEDSIDKIDELAKDQGRPRDVVVWEDGLTYKTPGVKPPAIADKVVVQIWKNPTKATEFLHQGRDIIWSHYETMYLDCGRGSPVVPTNDSWCGSHKTWWDIYRETPDFTIQYDKTLPNVGKIRGGEVALWTEQTGTSIVANLLWPRVAAWGGAAWEARTDVPKEPSSATTAAPVFEARRQLVSFATILEQNLGIKPTPIVDDWCVFNEENLCDAFAGYIYDQHEGVAK